MTTAVLRPEASRRYFTPRRVFIGRSLARSLSRVSRQPRSSRSRTATTTTRRQHRGVFSYPLAENSPRALDRRREPPRQAPEEGLRAAVVLALDLRRRVIGCGGDCGLMDAATAPLRRSMIPNDYFCCTSKLTSGSTPAMPSCVGLRRRRSSRQGRRSTMLGQRGRSCGRAAQSLSASRNSA
jgi:hypothetical protein